MSTFLKKYSPLPDLGTGKYLISLVRGDLMVLVRTLTGHSSLRGHLFRIGKADCDNCLAFGMSSEMVIHFLLRCDAYAVSRLDLLERHPFQLEECHTLQLWKSTKSTSRFKPHPTNTGSAEL